MRSRIGTQMSALLVLQLLPTDLLPLAGRRTSWAVTSGVWSHRSWLNVGSCECLVDAGERALDNVVRVGGAALCSQLVEPFLAEFVAEQRGGFAAEVSDQP